MDISWSTLSSDQLKAEAASYLEDHNDGSTAFFDPDQGLWRLESIDPLKLSAFDSRKAADAWIREEIQAFYLMGDSRGQMYQTMIESGFNDPVIVGVSHEGAKLWDGYHRTAIAMVRGEKIPSIVGYADPLVASLSDEPRTFSQRELEAMDIDILDVLAFGYKSGDVVELDPRDILIKYPCDLDNPIEKFRTGGMAWVRSVSLEEPVEVSIGEDGKKYLEDGHHRRFSALKQGFKLKAEIEVKGSPVAFILNRQSELYKIQKSQRPNKSNNRDDDSYTV
jgi:hypothetical protein